MTDEEKLEEIKRTRKQIENFCNYKCAVSKGDVVCINCVRILDFETGLTEGRKEKWHDLRKDPNDLPPRIKKLSETVINEIGTPCHYNFEKSCWQNWSLIDIETPIAWCKLPKYEE